MDLKQLSKEIKTPWGEIGYVTFKRTYARRLKEDDANSKTEEFWQVIERELESSDKQLNVGFTDEEKQRYAETRLQLKWSVAGRFMWQLGTKTVDKLGLPSLQNCAAVVINEAIRPFTWTFEMLMLGSGVGYNIQKHNVYQLPKVKNKLKILRNDSPDADFIVPDSREGWVKLLAKVLKAHFYSGESFTYSTQLIRSKGAPIKGFGGTASGPEELCWGIAEINKILNSRSNKKLRPIDCLDVMNILGFIVVAGNVRRSAQLAIGDYDDIDFLTAKRWDLGTIPKWRGMSNNSVAAPEDLNKLPKEYWDTYLQGEPYGLINIELSKEVGRTGETQYPDPNVEVYNPCAEQSLINKETCCLGLVFLPNIDTYNELLECLTFAYRMCKHSLALHCSIKDTGEIVNKYMRMGIGLPGWLQATEEQRSWAAKAYVWLRGYDKWYSGENRFPESIKLTTSKPDGTGALLPGVLPGCMPSPAPSQYYWRTMRLSSQSPLVEVCKKNGYKMEPNLNIDGSIDYNTVVVYFPCKLADGVPNSSEFTWRQQLDTIRRVQREWSDNSVSCTIYYNKEDIEDIKVYLNEHFRHEIKTVSFLLSHGHGFKQAPYQPITKEEYEIEVAKVKPITDIDSIEESLDVVDCDSGSCPIK
jgi:ribonucleoside-triphosphate reductase (thioredoxin)